ncbi:flagellar biosynthetic protein FliQ [Aestuariivirga sp.]|uniref:flagellar biosynthetic protein FliQ n=1 Tax=Aestuariivirga sp. TaxID=2650926 RepID=UPI0039E2580D
MSEIDALEIIQTVLWTIIIASSPLVLPAMAVGIVIAFGQALTQVQEATLTFVPKMLVVFFAAMLAGSFIASQLNAVTEQLYGRIATGF